MLETSSTYGGPVTTVGTVAGPSSFAPVRHRKIAIIGFGKTAKYAPWEDTSWEVWGMNGFWRAQEPDHGVKVPEARYSLWFDTHTLDYTRQYGLRAGIGDAQEKWLQQEHPFPILGVEVRPEWPSVQMYPIDDVVARFGRDYFTSTVAYAIALAASLEDVAEIGLWGVDLIHDTEYADQRPCAEYWLARAEGLGIKVTTHQGSALLKQRTRYGFADVNSPLLNELRNALLDQKKGLEESIGKNQTTVRNLEAQLHTDDGALQVVRQLLSRLDLWDRGGQI